ncbi:TetR/AcrR family transcriptional regulator [Pontibacter sp. G13]|uniref:TetR/AcrR family transcriptional regulator n=1 Tax=Pontibacter sp. G13 TaxID=3074898 RepID=UPI00288C1AAE|nr:TetR/AcrR family transcriptional regulator [Pontibacter sp. G13]WNJ20024.1 TetR/AcrR family transcriptional regulator [Pontibacter sp. G13]
MKELFGHIQIQVNEKVYLKDPNSSDLGKRILGEGLLLIDEVGLERFTFRKLAKRLETTESSIYRYFENKHKLLIYFISWYWGWLEYQLVFSTANLSSAEEKLRIAIRILAANVRETDAPGPINVEVLNRLVVSESSKAYLTKEVDEANKEGFYLGYKRLVGRVADFVSEINADYPYPHTLISTIAEGIQHQKYFADHLPSLTDIQQDAGLLATCYTDMALSTVTQYSPK